MAGPANGQGGAARAVRSCVADLTGGEPPRVWSLIVSFLGDMAQGEGDEIGGAALSRICALAGIRAASMRVALHRLGRDGWIETRREGRGSYYFLSAHGRAESAAATPRIFADRPASPEAWRLLLAAPGDAEGAAALAEAKGRMEGALPAGPLALLAPADCAQQEAPPQLLAMDGRVAPAVWLRETVFPVELREAAARLADALAQVVARLAQTTGLTPLQVAALRTLVVHEWRRILLRHADLPPPFFPDGWRGETCRGRVREVLARLPRPSLRAIEDDAARARA